MHYTPKTELDARIKKFQSLLAANDLDGALIAQNVDLFYFAGTIQQSQLYIPREGLPILMTRRSFPRARAESALERVVPLASPRDVPRLLHEHGYALPRRLGLELDILPTNLYLGYREIFAGAELVDASPLIRRVRAVKSAYELAAMRRAAKIGETTMRAMRELLVEGISEIELAGKLEAVARGAGHQGMARFRLWNNEMFYGHLMTGKNTAMPSYLSSPTGGPGLSPAFSQGSSQRKIRRGEPVLFDYVFVSDGYIVDQTRIFAIGKLPDKLLRAHAAMVEIQDAIAAAAKPGVTGGEMFQLAVDLAQKYGYAENLGGSDKDRITFVGHGIGLELDEYPFLAKGQAMPLEAGMVIAVEPKATFAKVGTVGIENTYVVTPRGARRITRGEDGVVIVSRRGV
ncbi:MAG: aminopeptidase P family protein [Chloroflexota bacterium]|nr:aminopeptidase P family protein [Chloroflexota bacterium]